MFRRLAETFQDSGDAGYGDGAHSAYVNSQNKYFNSVSNIILSGTSGLKDFDKAIKSIDSQNNAYQPTFTKYPNNIFIKESSPNLNALAQECSASSVDQLIATKNPNLPIGCGWLYTPPNKNSPYPVLSQGFIGTNDAPLDNFNPPDYKKWFFDLQLAKKQVLLDKCKALKACTDIDSEVFKGACGYCKDTNQGVPIDNVGKPLYEGDPIGTCSPEAVVTDSSKCPPPEPTNGPQPIIDRTCEPINGRLSASCLYNQVISGGCNNNGSLAIALAGSPPPSDYIASIRDGDSVKIYNRVANPPLKLDIFSQGATTIDTVLTQVRQLASNTMQPENTAIGAAARDLCLQKGAISKYDFCNDLPDTTTSPFNMECLQQIFRKMGGQPAGTAYPNQKTIVTYNSMGNLGAVKQYFGTLIQNMKSVDYTTQRNAMIQFLGISPEQLISRSPYNQGVEVIWFLQKPGTVNVIQGILKRTIEKDIVQFAASSNPIPQLASTYPGFRDYSSMIQMFDVRAAADFSTKFTVNIDDGFFIAVNQPVDIAKNILPTMKADQPGLFAAYGVSTFMSNSCSNYNAVTPNITKIYYSDGGGGLHALKVSTTTCSGQSSLSSPYYSLTLEPRAPFLNFEVNSDGDAFDDTRNPGLFSNLIQTNSLDFHNRTDERISVPGKKGFVRFTNNSTSLNLVNIAYQSWGTVTFAFRLQSMPVKDAIFSFWVYNKYCVIYLQPINGSTAQIRIQTTMTTNNTVFDGATKFTVQIGNWYYLAAAQTTEGFDINCDSVDSIIKNNNFSQSAHKVTNSGPITTTENYGLYAPGKYNCNIGIGGKLSGLNLYSGSFQFDLAWVHFYDYYIGSADITKDCNSAWIFTQFPNSPNSYTSRM